MKQKLFFFLVCVLWVGIPLNAQHFSIKGKVTDTKQEIIAGASVLLYSVKDSTQTVGATITDNRGRFNLQELPADSYRLRVSFVGYKNEVIQIDNLSANIKDLQVTLTEQSVLLDEVAVTANRVVLEFDRQIVYPGKEEKERSMDGVNFIDNLQLTGVVVDRSNNLISGIRGGTISLRVNGAPADINDIRNIDPKLVTRVEYHDIPSLRYGDVEGVIDMYVKRSEFGGSGIVGTNNWVTSLNNSENMNLKLNNQRSEFSISGSFNNMRTKDTERYKQVDYLFEDGTSLSRKESTLGTYQNNAFNGVLNYNYLAPDNKLFQAKLSYSTTFNSYSKSEGTITEESTRKEYRTGTTMDRKGHAPRVNLYYQQNLKNKQFIAFEVMGSYSPSNIDSYYQEMYDGNVTTDIANLIDGNPYSLTLEGIYEKRFKAVGLSAGVNQRFSWVDNQYSGTSNILNQIDNYTTNAYAQLIGKKNKFTYGIGARGVFNQIHQSNLKRHSSNFAANLLAGYQFTRSVQLRYTGSMTVTLPTIGSLSEVDLNFNGYESVRGNSGLNSVTRYDNALNFLCQKGGFTYMLDARDSYTKSPMLSSILRESGKFISQTQNGDYLHLLTASGTIKWRSQNRQWNLMGSAEYNHFKNSTASYSHSLNTWGMSINGIWDYKTFSIRGGYYRTGNALSSERISYGYQRLTCGIQYVMKNWGIMADASFRIGNKHTRSENLNPYMRSHQSSFAPDNNTIIRIQAHWRFQFGKQRKSVGTRIENKGTTNTTLQ